MHHNCMLVIMLILISLLELRWIRNKLSTLDGSIELDFYQQISSREKNFSLIGIECLYSE